MAPAGSTSGAAWARGRRSLVDDEGPAQAAKAAASRAGVVVAFGGAGREVVEHLVFAAGDFNTTSTENERAARRSIEALRGHLERKLP